jgi:hypothetical protein
MAFIPDEAVDRMCELSAGAWRLYCFLARCRNQKSGECFPSVETTASAIDMHPKNVFRARRELATEGWANFDGDNVIDLLGFSESSKNATSGSKNATPTVAKTLPTGSKNATESSKNATIELQKRYSHEEEPAKLTSKHEPAKEPTAAAARAREEIETRIAELQAALIRVTGYRVDNSFAERKVIEVTGLLHADGATVAEVETFAQSRRAPPKMQYFVTDFREWKQRTQIHIPDKPQEPQLTGVAKYLEIARQKREQENATPRAV